MFSIYECLLLLVFTLMILCMDSRRTFHYNVLLYIFTGYHKDILIAPSAPERGILRNSFQGNLRTFISKPEKARSSFHSNIRNPGRTHSYGGYQPRAVPSQPTIVEYDRPSDDPRMVSPGTKQPVLSGLMCDSRSNTSPKVQFDLRNKRPQDIPAGYSDNNKRFEPIMFARCHGSLTRPSESNLSSKPPTYTSAHGYQANKDSGTKLPSKQPKPPQRLYPNVNRGNITTSEDCGSSTSGSYHVEEEEPTTITHVVDGVKVTDIVV